ncbi:MULTISPECIES: TetR/AcrR family transcriptional regulator [Streptosporangium]|uniref:AcrR family transcriptional regulator n=1 Tax=Streptosporangium brasiliense TaxID=47480 RepID=A0ABT9RD20_9ACTN|nr:TetR/AcrR family transcriptional regulator [Streptosporangium brasiliense]MDP9866300.1 AcrR family transcriptional regulator [Streptosporangium brasiliense]
MERADAARNRARILEAAGQLFAAKGAPNVTMDDIARAAGVGRGTLYRRYPDRAAIATAMLDEHEKALQEKLIGGQAPLGPGAPPAERLAAFYAAMVELLEAHAHLVLGTETGRSRFATGAYGFWRLHVRSLLASAGAPDPDTLVEVVLAPLAPEVYTYQRTERDLSPGRIAAALGELAHRLLGAQPPAREGA